MKTNRVSLRSASVGRGDFANSWSGRQNMPVTKKGRQEGSTTAGQLANREDRKAADTLILVPIDSPAAGVMALELAIGIAQRANGHVLLVHAIALNLAEYGPANPERMKADERLEMERELGKCVAISRKAGVPASCIISEGSVPEVIDRVAREQRPALIVLGSRRAGRLARLVSRHTVKKVVQSAVCPVLVVQTNK